MQKNPPATGPRDLLTAKFVWIDWAGYGVITLFAAIILNNL